MISPLEFEGGYQLGPKSFAEQTGRDQVWKLGSQQPQLISKRERNCLLCGANKPERLFDAGANHWDYSKCSQCGMVYTVMTPEPSELDTIYKTAPAMQEWVRLQQNPIEVELDTKKFQWALELAGWSHLCTTNEKPLLVDIGCSTGTLLVTAGRMVPESVVYGIEINEGALGVANARLSAIQKVPRWWALYKDVEGFCKHHTGAGAHLVVLWEVLEHLVNPKKMLADAANLTGPGGKVLICVPNIDSLAARILHENTPMFGLGHINMFSPETLGEFVIQCGLKPVTTTSIISWYNEIQNWLNLRPPMHADKPERVVMTDSPEETLKSLQGYKLVMVAEKEK